MPGHTPLRELTESEIEYLAVHVAAKIDVSALSRQVAKHLKSELYIEVGRTVVQRFLWIVGLVVTSLALWLAAHGKFKTGG